MAGLTKAQKAAKTAGAQADEQRASVDAEADAAKQAEATNAKPDAAAKKAAVTLPESVTLASPYGYDPEIEGQPHKMWSAGQVVTDPEEIKDLIERQAPLED